MRLTPAECKIYKEIYRLAIRRTNADIKPVKLIQLDWIES